MTTTKPTADCKSKGWCHYDGPRRTKFFHGMLLTDEHLRMEQSYHRKAMARLHRYLWGPGIVCGFEVEKVSALCIKIHAGLAIDCHGNAIESCGCVTLDLSEECRKHFPGGCATGDAPELTKYLVIRYGTVDEDPQPVHGTSDECGQGNGPPLQASRVREGFCLELADACPEPCKKEETTSHSSAQQQSQSTVQHSASTLSESVDYKLPGYLKPRPCPPCECDCGCGAIGLAKLAVNCKTSTVTVDSSTCRLDSQRLRDYREEALFEEAQQKQIATLERLVKELDYRLDQLSRYRTFFDDLRQELPQFARRQLIWELQEDVAKRVLKEEFTQNNEYVESQLRQIAEDAKLTKVDLANLESKVDQQLSTPKRPSGRGGSSTPSTPPATPSSPPPADPNAGP